MFSRRKFIKATAISASLIAVDKKSIASLTPPPIQKGFSYAVCTEQQTDLLIPGKSYY